MYCRWVIKSVLLLPLLSGAAVAETLYVNNLSGADHRSGRAASIVGRDAGPLKTLAAALRRAQRGDRIVLANTGVPYNECVTVQGARNSGWSYAPFVIEGNGAVLDGTGEVPADRWQWAFDGTFRFVPEHGGPQRLFLGGRDVLQTVRGDQAELKQPRWYARHGQIHVRTPNETHPAGYEFRFAQHRVGITLYDVENVVIRNLRLRGFQRDGINAHGNAFECVLAEVDCSDNGRAGVSIGGSSRVRVVDSVLSNNGASQLRVEGAATAKLTRTEMNSANVPHWTRQASIYGMTSRLLIDDEAQLHADGWPTEKQRKAFLKTHAPASDETADNEAKDADATDKKTADNKPDNETPFGDDDAPAAGDAANSGPDDSELLLPADAAEIDPPAAVLDDAGDGGEDLLNTDEESDDWLDDQSDDPFDEI